MDKIVSRKLRCPLAPVKELDYDVQKFKALRKGQNTYLQLF